MHNVVVCGDNDLCLIIVILNYNTHMCTVYSVLYYIISSGCMLYLLFYYSIEKVKQNRIYIQKLL